MEYTTVFFAGVFLLQVYSAHLQKICQPPSYPEGGSFFPNKSSYLFGERVTYTCEDHLTRFGAKENTCLQTTKWLHPVPFCDSPTKLKHPNSFSVGPLNKLYNGQATHLIDKNPETCIPSIQTIKVYLDQPAPVYAVRLFLKKGSVNLEINLERPPQKGSSCFSYKRDIEADQWVTIDCIDSNHTVEFVTVQDKSGNPNKLTICEIEVYVKDGLWCSQPPRRIIENGLLEVSRSVAILHCSEGYRPPSSDRLVCALSGIWEGPELVCREIFCEDAIGPDSLFIGLWVESKGKQPTLGTQRQLICPPGYHVKGEPNIVTCLKSGQWTKTNATCIVNPPKKESSSKIIGIAVGCVGGIVIIFLMCLTGYLIYKRGSKEVVVVYKTDGSATPGLEPEYSTIYYDAIQKGSFSPMTPPRPLNLLVKDEPGYSKPIDERTPVDLAFGTLKSSALYDAMND